MRPHPGGRRSGSVSTQNEAVSLAPADEVTSEPTWSSLVFFLRSNSREPRRRSLSKTKSRSTKSHGTHNAFPSSTSSTSRPSSPPRSPSPHSRYRKGKEPQERARGEGSSGLLGCCPPTVPDRQRPRLCPISLPYLSDCPSQSCSLSRVALC